MILNKSHNLIIVIIITVIGIFYFSTIREGHQWGGDFSMYIHHAKNIASGTDYKDTGYIYNPSDPFLGPKTYPPVLPLLLSPIYKWFGLNLTAMKIEIIAMFLLFLFIYFLIFRKEVPFRYLVMMILIIGLNPFFWNIKDSIGSSIPFLLLSYISLFLLLKEYHSNKSQSLQLLYSMFVGFLIYLSYGPRSIGIVIIPSLFILDILREKKITRFTIIVTGTFIFFMFVQNMFFHSDSSYFNMFTSYPIASIPYNIFKYVWILGSILSNGYSIIFAVILFLVVGVFALFGYAGRIKNRVTILEVFLPLYLGVIIIFPANQAHYLVPVIPLLIFYAFIGFLRTSFFQKKYIYTILIAIIFVSYIGKYTTLNFELIDEGIGKKESKELFDYIRKNTSKDNIFIFLKPRILSLFTDRSASIYHQPKDDKQLLKYFHDVEATYIVEFTTRSESGNLSVNSDDVEYLVRFIEKNNANFEEVYSNLDFRMYKIKNLQNQYVDN